MFYFVRVGMLTQSHVVYKVDTSGSGSGRYKIIDLCNSRKKQGTRVKEIFTGKYSKGTQTITCKVFGIESSLIHQRKAFSAVVSKKHGNQLVFLLKVIKAKDLYILFH